MTPPAPSQPKVDYRALVTPIPVNGTFFGSELFAYVIMVQIVQMKLLIAEAGVFIMDSGMPRESVPCDSR